MKYSGTNNRVGALRCIEAELDDGVLTVALNRPDQRNAINVAMTLEMQSLLEAVGNDPMVRVVVLRGNGAGFCAGIDAADFADPTQRDPMTGRAAREAAAEWGSRGLRGLPQPVIAMVHGCCHGGAIGVVEACDIALAAHDADFALAEAGAGPLPIGPVGKAVSRVMTPRAASFFALSGRSFDGREAERNGLITLSVAADDLGRETSVLARELVAKDAIALQFTKETLRHVGSMSWDAALNFNAAKFAELKALQAGRPSTRAAAVESFLAGKSKPGLGG